MTLLVEFAGGVGFKPRAGNDYRFNHDDYRRALDDCHIYGKDARRLAEASPGQLHPLDVNRTVGVPEAVAVVDPTRARLYKGSRYAKSCSIASGGTTPPEGQLEQRVPDVAELIDPVVTVELPPLVKGERADPAAVADAYEPAYEQLFDAAGWE